MKMRNYFALFTAALMFALSADSAVAQPSEIWDHTNFAAIYYVNTDLVCSIDQGDTCPREMSWMGRKLKIRFQLAPEDLVFDEIRFSFNVSYRNHLQSTDALLRISAGTNPESLIVVANSIQIDRVGIFSVAIDPSYFAVGADNYIELYGVNVEPVGYGTNPPNFGWDRWMAGGYYTSPPVVSDEELLDQTGALSARYLYEQVLSNGLVKDKLSSIDASTAATGFGLSAYTVMAKRLGTSPQWNYYTRADLLSKTNQILDTLLSIQNAQAGSELTYGKAGLFYHYINSDNTPRSDSEVSTVDTAILAAGAITAGEYWGGEVRQKVSQLMQNLDWSYYYVPAKQQFSHGWKNGSLLSTSWDWPTDEALLVSLIAMATDLSNADFPKTYFGWPRPSKNYAGYDVVYSYFGSLFTYFFAHIWYDFAALGPDDPSRVQGALYPVSVDWWINSLSAAASSRQFAIDNASTYSTYGPNSWGLTACERPNGIYGDKYGAKPAEYNFGNPIHDGTIAPYGAISTMPFFASSLSDNLAFQALRHYYESYYLNLWGTYGPKDSFDTASFSNNYLGIDVGPQALMIENFRSGFVMDTFMRNQEVRLALEKVFSFQAGVPPDFDGDGDVDQSDFGMFQVCITGPDMGPPEPGCERADFDYDTDVDADDFEIFEFCSSGPAIAYPEECKERFITWGNAIRVASPLDSDQDAVSDALDECPDTLPLTKVDERGCSITQFCESISIQSTADIHRCRIADWRGNGTRRQGDCHIVKMRKPAPQVCMARSR